MNLAGKAVMVAAEMEKKNADGGSGDGFIEAEKVERRQESARRCR
jgi:hypothetical protein